MQVSRTAVCAGHSSRAKLQKGVDNQHMQFLASCHDFSMAGQQDQGWKNGKMGEKGKGPLHIRASRVTGSHRVASKSRKAHKADLEACELEIEDVFQIPPGRFPPDRGTGHLIPVMHDHDATLQKSLQTVFGSDCRGKRPES